MSTTFPGWILFPSTRRSLGIARSGTRTRSMLSTCTYKISGRSIVQDKQWHWYPQRTEISFESSWRVCANLRTEPVGQYLSLWPEARRRERRYVSERCVILICHRGGMLRTLLSRSAAKTTEGCTEITRFTSRVTIHGAMIAVHLRNPTVVNTRCKR
jgi:hypothetical protein